MFLAEILGTFPLSVLSFVPSTCHRCRLLLCARMSMLETMYAIYHLMNGRHKGQVSNEYFEYFGDLIFKRDNREEAVKGIINVRSLFKYLLNIILPIY